MTMERIKRKIHNFRCFCSYQLALIELGLIIDCEKETN